MTLVLALATIATFLTLGAILLAQAPTESHPEEVRDGHAPR